jgi:hypothetical protein
MSAKKLGDKRNVYTITEKCSVIRMVQENNLSLRQAEKEVGVDRKLLRDWINKSPQLMQAEGTSSCRLSGGGRKCMYPELEKQILDWLKDQRERNLELRNMIFNRRLKILLSTWKGWKILQHLCLGCENSV